MSDLIFRLEAIEAIVNTPSEVYRRKELKTALDGAAYRQFEIVCAIEKLHRAEPESLTGTWINLTPPQHREALRKETIGGCVHWMCSLCKNAAAFIAEDLPYDLCPHCGAKMEVEHERFNQQTGGD